MPAGFFTPFFMKENFSSLVGVFHQQVFMKEIVVTRPTTEKKVKNDLGHRKRC